MTENREKIGVLFVCMGNICRSPTAEGVFRKHVTDAGLAEWVDIDSAGTHAYHTAAPADRRAMAAAEKRGYSLADITARHVQDEDFERYDLVLAMDDDNVRALRDRCDAIHHEKIRLFLEFADVDTLEVPDPYYGGTAGFERVLDLVESASIGLLTELQKKKGSGNA
ncbi:MAG: low molecular weight protein-tyrosine-phosphatase [Woeseia sp.]